MTCLKHFLFEKYDLLALCSVMLLGSNPSLITNVIWIFANIAGELNLELRDMLIRHTSVIDYLGNLVS